MVAPMNNMATKEYLSVMRVRYRKSSKAEKTVLIDEIMKVLKIARKSAIRSLNRNPKTRTLPRTPRYIYGLDLQAPLIILWNAAGRPCAKRLEPQMAILITQLEKFNEIKLYGNQKELLCRMSNWTINNLLVEQREKLLGRGMSGTRRSPLLKSLIPIRTNHYDVPEPGHVETDCVLHCGSSLKGIYAETVNILDIATHWNEKRMIMKKTHDKVIGAIHEARNDFPFQIKSLDFDNGIEFVNWHMHGYCTREGIAFTRSRSYHKNDQAHIEGKNYESIRRVVGYGRIEDTVLVSLWNDIYQEEHRLLTNFFYATMKLKRKERVGAKTTKQYELAQTPYARVMSSDTIELSTKDRLKEQYDTLNPMALQRSMKRKIEKIQRYMKIQNTVTVSNLATYPSSPMLR